jgi:secondary thiamine-phosphate synthase enzyme
MIWHQETITLKPRSRGFHIITDEIESQVPALRNITVGLAHIFIKHTSASLTINENADPDVRRDMESHFNVLVPEDATHYRHTIEGPDDMTSHIKSSLLGSAVTVPISDGKLNLGTWQGIFLCEHRNHPHRRTVVVTVTGSDGNQAG